ncbi:MAG TPA: NAD-dependent epimerase/dehydratase family protein [Candidatus Omnitrophota bacterium]|nr:NAD-dependent epimerase/dehydratase family protein [Candidatus Omnitrophota bacterium]
MNKVLVTGATGFVGSALVRALLKHGNEVHVLVRQRGPSFSNLEGLHVVPHFGDIQSIDSLKEAMKGIKVVYHTAAVYQFFPWWKKTELPIYKVNLEGTKNVVECAKEAGVKKMVYTSSIITIGKSPGKELSDETTPFSASQLNSHYARSKYETEQWVLEEAKKGFPVVIVNPGIVFGERDSKPTPSGEIIVKFLNRKYPGYVDFVWCTADVDDVAEGHIQAAEKGRIGERYILCNNEHYSLEELFRFLEDISGLKRPRIKFPVFIMKVFVYVDEWLARFIKRQPLMPSEGLKFCSMLLKCSNAKAVKELGYRTTSIEETLAKAVRWYRDHGYVKKTFLSSTSVHPRGLSIRECKILKALVDRIIPETNWDCGAAIVAKINQVLGEARQQLWWEFRLLLYVLEYALPLLCFKWKSFTRMSTQEKDDFLAGLERSGWSLKRMCFQAIKRSALAAFYGSEESWPSIRYLGPWLERGYPYEYEGKGIQVPK